MHDDQNYRIAALKLHGLHPEDRAWLLAHFQPSQQEKLRNLIQELDDLGFVSTEKIQDKDISYPVGKYQLDTNTVAEINQADPELIMKELSGLPELLKAMILHTRHWHWSSLVWLKIDSYERQRLLRYVSQFDAIKHSVFIALVESFADTINKSMDGNFSVHSPAARAGQSKFWMS